jgi:predicted transposase YdaD
MPQSEDPEIPVIFLEAQMQPDSRFYGRYFAELFLYLYQYRIERPWRGLLILQSPQQDLGSDVPYADLLDGKVQRIYLQDLVSQTELPPALALLQLLVFAKIFRSTGRKTIAGEYPKPGNRGVSKNS